jgi:hypothetical protein
MKYIETGQTRSDVKRKWLVMVDDEDYDFLNQHYWQVDKFKSVGCHTKVDGKRKNILIHRLIMKPPKGVEIDHIDGNRLNNQKSNLRFATSSQNKINRGARKDCKSGYKGVSWHKQRNCWTSRLMIDGKYQHLGLFKDKHKAAQVYNDNALKHYGEYAWLNKIVIA